MFVSDLVTEIFAVTLLGISGLDEINYNVPSFLYAVNIYIDTNVGPISALMFLLAQIAPFLVTTCLLPLGNEKNVGRENGAMRQRVAGTDPSPPA